jgi:nondiscriminating glutamyl-tRNA synthetase
MYRTRQAPSPTGYLHIGTARTVLFTHLFAMINEGHWYLRLEDTDRNRLQPESVKILLGALDLIGLQPQEGVSLTKSTSTQDEFYGVYQNGDYGPYIQSERLPIYHEHAQKLVDKQLAYWSYLTPVQKQDLQEIKQATKRPINYFKICTDANPDKLFQSVAEGLKDESKPVLMYKIQREGVITCNDELLGNTKFDLSLEEDFGILKSDGFPTYHLAHLIDDQLMKTTVVIRSQEWLPSVAKHQTMFQDYWGQSPKYMHIPFILGETGNKKMSKRDGNVNLQDYIDKGYTPEAIINYLAFLGWNPGTEKELYLDQADFE